MNDARTAALAPSLFVLLWSTGFIAAKYGLPYAPPLTFLLYRFVLVAALMAIVCVVTGARWPSQRIEYVNVAIAAWLVHGLYLGGVFVALSKGLPAGTAAMLVGLQPIVSASSACGWSCATRSRSTPTRSRSRRSPSRSRASASARCGRSATRRTSTCAPEQ
jgi:drug/metabolite transporter (DMT)-like permease